jgi:hypothetical protein
MRLIVREGGGGCSMWWIVGVHGKEWIRGRMTGWANCRITNSNSFPWLECRQNLTLQNHVPLDSPV